MSKRPILSLALLLLAVLAVDLAGQTTVTIGSGTTTTQYLPLRCRGYYSYSQQIYTKAQINFAGNIQYLRFYKSTTSTPSNSSSWTLYLGHTTKTGFSSTSDWVPVANLTQVFSGTVSFPSSGWMTITLATPFAYNNVDNLVVALDENTSGRASSEIYWRNFASGSNTGLYYNGSSNPSPSSPPAGTRVSSLSQLQLETPAPPPGPITVFPYTQSFDATTFPPTGWLNFRTAGSGTGTWNRATSGSNPSCSPFSGAGMTRYNSDSYTSGTCGVLVTPPLNLPAEGYSVSFRIYRDTASGSDKLRVHYNTAANLTGASLLGTINRLTSASPYVRDAGWYKYTLDLPAGSAGDARYILFEGVSAKGNNIFVDDVSIAPKTYPAPTPRFVAEWEPAVGSIIRYPFGQPNALIADLSNQGLLYVVVASSSQSACNSALNAISGMNMANVRYVNASTNTYWTRDYGPWTIFDGNRQMKIVDFNYNRPRYQDDVIPVTLANYLGIGYYTMNYTATGGNIMTDGNGKAMSTDLVLRENALLTRDYIDQMFEDYLGVSEYQIYADPLLGGSIDHIDCWGKLLDVDKVLIAQVPSSHSNYAALEAAVDAWESKTSSYGTPYRIYRAYAPNNQPYTNSFIFNKKIYVPQSSSTPTSYDLAAVQTYRDAMPGYSVVSYYNSSFLSDDAIHCRVNTVFDANMVHVWHLPIPSAAPESWLNVSAQVSAASSVENDSTYVSYRFKNNSTGALSNWVTVPLAWNEGNTWSADIPTPALGYTLQYTLRGTDSAGRTHYQNLCGRSDPFSVAMVARESASAENPPELPLQAELLPVYPNPFNPTLFIPFRLNAPAQTSIRVYNNRGQLVRSLDSGAKAAGDHQTVWDGSDSAGKPCGTGVYFINLQAGGQSLTRKAVLVK